MSGAVKKALLISTACVCMASFLPGAVPAVVTQAADGSYGDINHDSKIDVQDFKEFQKYMLGLDGQYYEDRLDVNSDGRINILDCCVLKELILKAAQEPPVTTQPPVTVDPAAYMQTVRSALVETEPSSVDTQSPGVDYGTVESKTYYSKAAEKTKALNVILPAGYNKNEQYPVLYVLHGIFGDQNSMLDDSMKLQTIIGNLTASGNAQKMIIVCPSMYTSKTKDQCSGFTVEDTIAYDNIREDITESIMPWMQENYSVKTGRENTAITGFSMGGREALYCGVTRPDVFGYIGAACPAPGVTPATDQFMAHPGNMQESEFRISNKAYSPYLFLISGAANDPVVGTNPQNYHNILTKNGTDHIWQQIAAGDHGGNTVRPHLYNFAQYIFKATSQSSSGQPQVTDPPVTQPPVTNPPVTDPPVSQTQVTEPPSSKDPAAYMQTVRSALVETEPSSADTKSPGVDYGTVESKTYFSNAAAKNKSLNVILPAGYNKNEQYPVLYVLHGIFGDQNSMLDDSMKLQTIIGNLTASGNAQKMIIVCPSMYTSKTKDQCSGFTVEDTIAYDNIREDITESIMPWMQENYSVKTGRENTAITGFSMGGREALYCGVTRPDVFGYIGAACPAPGVTPATDQFMAHPGNMQESEFRISNKAYSPYLFLISGAANDPVVGTNPQNYHNILTKNGTDHIWQQIAAGDHGGNTVRPHLYNFAQYIFRCK
ncbi:MAG: alpha/beta hydrolase-fold protein [Oscillospiraceae bacterium]|nr:alpha/beta hydrolase-fold protein [Oscillospiraceae bacterium]